MTVEYNKTNIVTVQNELEKGQIRVIKIDKDYNSIKLGGIVFEVLDSDKKLIETITTGADGTAVTSKLPSHNRTYYLREKSTLDTYILNTGEISTTIVKDQIKDITIENEHKKGNLRIIKVDQDISTKRIQGVQFEITNVETGTKHTGTTNANGELILSNIRTGAYTIKELSTNEWYRLNTNTFNVTVQDKNVVQYSTITIQNEVKKAKIQVTKQDKEYTGMKLEGFVFAIYDDKNVEVDRITTGANGTATSKDLRIDTVYTIKEVGTRADYKADAMHQTINWTSGEDNVLKYATFENTKKKGDLYIRKIDFDDQNILMGAIEFELYKVDETWDFVTNNGGKTQSSFIGTLITNADGEAKFIGNDIKGGVTTTTASDGTVYIQNLRIGKYVLKEVGIGKWYELVEDTDIEIKENERTNVTVKNEKKKAHIQIKKVDSDYTDIAVEGVTFDIYDNNNVKVDTITTNSSGIATSKLLYIDRPYLIVESDTNPNYVMLDQNCFVDLRELINDYTKEMTYTITIGNEHKKGSLKIIKVDEENYEYKLEGVTFELYKTDENYSSFVPNNGNKVESGYIGTYTTDVNGEIFIDNLRTGEFKLKEVETQIWYDLKTEDTLLNIEHSKITELQIGNVVKKARIQIHKVDADYNDIKLEGIQFTIYNEQGNEIETITTNNLGIATSSLLPIQHTYTIKEKLGKDEYKTLNEEIQVDLSTLLEEYISEMIYELEIENEHNKGNLEILKVDKDYKNVALEGVSFDIYKIDEEYNFIEDNGNKEQKSYIGTYTTDQEGKIYIENLRTGKYIAKEIISKDGYILLEDVEFEIKENETTKLIVENERKKGNLIIRKMDFDDNKIPVADVKFEITDIDGYTYTAVSDKQGIVQINNIRTGEITIKELSTNIIYKLNEEEYSLEIEWNKTQEITIQNEKLKGQIEVYKTDLDDNEIKLADVEFEVINSDGEVVQTIVTNKDGYAITNRMPIGEYRIRESKTGDLYVLDETLVKVDVSADVISILNLTNERIKGQIKVIKTSKDNNFINDTEADTPIQNVEFEVYDFDRQLVTKLITGEDGIAITDMLYKGIYYIKETSSGEWYLLNEEEFTVEIAVHREVVELNITNESEKPSVDIEKEGIIQTTKNEEIRYDFKIENTGNVPLDHFTWYDYLPSDYIQITKLITGTYNQDLNYSIYYKTNNSDYKLLQENLNTKANNYIDLSNIVLEDGEIITEFKVDFGTVDVGFESVIHPYIFTKVNSNVKYDDTFTNKTRIEGYNRTYMVWDNDDHTTKVYEKELKLKKLPKTGF